MIFTLRYLLPATVFAIVLVVAQMTWAAGTAETRRSAWLTTLLPAGIAGLLAWGALRVVEFLLSVRFLAGGPEESAVAAASGWAALSYFVAMVLGMIAQSVWHAIQARKAKEPPIFDKWEFVKPALVAPIVFISVYHNITQIGITIPMLLFSFQNGFFWQTVLKSSKV